MYCLDEDEAMMAYQNGDLGLHAKIKVRRSKEIDEMMKEAEANKEEDNKKKEAADTRNDAEQVIFMTEKAIKDLGEKVTEKDKKEAEKLIEKTKKALEGEDLEEIKNAKDELLNKANELATKVYEEAAKQNQTEEEKSIIPIDVNNTYIKIKRGRMYKLTFDLIFISIFLCHYYITYLTPKSNNPYDGYGHAFCSATISIASE